MEEEGVYYVVRNGHNDGDKKRMEEMERVFAQIFYKKVY